MHRENQVWAEYTSLINLIIWIIAQGSTFVHDQHDLPKGFLS